MFATFIRPVLLRMALEAAFGIGQVILAPATNSVPLAIGMRVCSQRKPQPSPRRKRRSVWAGADTGDGIGLCGCPGCAVPSTACRRCPRDRVT